MLEQSLAHWMRPINGGSQSSAWGRICWRLCLNAQGRALCGPRSWGVGANGQCRLVTAGPCFPQGGHQLWGAQSLQTFVCKELSSFLRSGGQLWAPASSPPGSLPLDLGVPGRGTSPYLRFQNSPLVQCSNLIEGHKPWPHLTQGSL